MTRFLAQRLVQLAPVLLLVSLVVFVIFRMVPGDPAIVILGSDPDPLVLAELRHQLRLDRPLAEQYLLWLTDVARGDLGHSTINGQEVAPLLLDRLIVTGQLAIAGLLLGTVVGVCAGIIAAWNRGGWIDLGARIIGLLGLCTPRYWLAILMVFIFSVQLRWLPVAGYVAPTEDPIGHLRYLILPAIAMGLPIAAIQMRFLRSSLLDVLNREYTRTARAKGLKERAVFTSHVLRNALVPLVTAIGLQAGYLLGGSIIVEQIFAWPGLGWLTLQAITQRDYEVVQGTVLLSALVFMLINLLVDVVYAVLDPRIRYGS